MVKWQDEMAEKFGLDFTIVDSAQLNAAAAQSRQRREPVPGVPADDRQPDLAARRQGRTAAAGGDRARTATKTGPSTC